MLLKSQVLRCVGNLMFSGALFFTVCAGAQSNLTFRAMAANITSGTLQSYETAGINIFKGLKPDVVAIQEFQYNSSSASNDLRTLVNTAFGTNYSFYCEPGYNIPNGIVSRWPILAAGTVPSPEVSDRGFAWARIDLPGTNDLYVVSVHLYGSGSASQRNNEAMTITNLMGTNFPAGAWIFVGGDFNTDSRTEACVTTFKTRLSDSPIPVDNNGNSNTSEPRSKPYDYMLPSFSLTNYQTPVVLTSHTFNNGLVFDSEVYTPLTDVSPVASGDSHVSNMQHMAVVKDFLISVTATNSSTTNAPSITTPPQSQTVATGSNAVFTVTADGAAPLAYQWRFNGTNLSGANATTLTLTNVQSTNAGNYAVLVTNIAGSVTSSIAVLTVSNFPPVILTQPQGQTVNVGASATFTVTAGGSLPLSYSWRFNGTNSIGTNTNAYTLNSVQTTNAGNYSVVITNAGGSVTSAGAVLSIVSTEPVVMAQWNFNSSTPDGTTTTGTTTPSIGAGTASLVGGTTSTFATGDTALDPAGSTDNSGWNTATYPAATANNKTAGVQFNVNTTDRQAITISWSERHSDTGSKYVRLQYSTNGSSFIDYPTSFSVATGGAYEAKSASLAGYPGVNNNSNFAFRVVSEFESTAVGGSTNYVPATSGKTYGPAGTIRFDMLTVSGSALGITTNPPAAPAILSAPSFNNGQFQLLVTGSAGSNYVMLTATNLATTNWFALFTNASPFIFTDVNLTTPQKFYRAKVQP
jgi:hypothetical protein